MRKVTLAGLVLLVSICTPIHLSPFAQSRKISGTVKDNQGNSLVSATGLVKNTEFVVFTNANGIFSINEVSNVMFVR